jgi:hypothetical protein
MMNDNHRIFIEHEPKGGFAVIVRGDELAEPHMSVHQTFDEAMSEALALQKAGEFKGAAIVDKTDGGKA